MATATPIFSFIAMLRPQMRLPPINGRMKSMAAE
jgi:hypothetical protein